ncbi:MAG: GTP-binding protein [Pseudodonghicola sp.]|nr:GTP-binding protein [Pseudodonghicola sp.]
MGGNNFTLGEMIRPQDGGRVPVTVLTGFLGAGKTTLLNGLVSRPDMAGVAVFINELGDIGIDHHLVERIDDALVILDSGCLCCTVQGDLMAALMRLHDRMARREIPPVSRVLIETTGLADPGPVLRALMEDRLVSARYRCDGILTVVDTTRVRDQIDRHREAVVQISMADRLLLSKCDLAGQVERDAVDRALAVLNPTASRIVLDHGAVDPEDLFASGLYATEDNPRDLNSWLGGTLWKGGVTPGQSTHGAVALPAGVAGGSGTHATPHSGRVRSFVVTFDVPPGWRGFSVALGEILSDWAGKLLRVKGLVALPGLEVPMAVQCVEETAYAPVRLDSWPKIGPLADRRGRLVFIGEDLTAGDEADIRTRLANIPGDRAALRQAAARRDLATRGWLAERLPLSPSAGLASEAFVIQPRFLGEARTHA